MFDHGCKRRETPVMIETALGVRPKPTQRGSAVPSVRRTIGLEIVDADLSRRMEIPTGLSEQRRNVANCTLAIAVENVRTSCSTRSVKTSVRCFRSWDRQLIEM